MQTHDQVVKKLMRRPGVRADVERLEREESALLDALLNSTPLSQSTALIFRRMISGTNPRARTLDGSAPSTGSSSVIERRIPWRRAALRASISSLLGRSGLARQIPLDRTFEGFLISLLYS